MTMHLLRRATLASLPFLLAAAPAFAHHPMGGTTPATFMQGLLSGVGHPVIGPDHLAFLVAMGIAVGIGRLSLALPVLFVAASGLGVVLHFNGINLPLAEVMVAASVVLAGALIATGRALPSMAWGALFAFAGLFHGYAFGEAIVGAESAPLGAYLLGLIIVQSALAVGVALAVGRTGAAISARAPRLAGAAIGAVGIAVLIGQFVSGA
jgi:urease accessory protein